MRKISEIASNIAEITGDTKKASKEFLDAFIDTVIQGLKDDGEVEVVGLGTFRARKRKANMGRNPLTGEKIQIPELKAIYFKASKQFKDSINMR